MAKGKLKCIYMSNVKVLLSKCKDFDSRYLTSAVQTDKQNSYLHPLESDLVQ